MLIAFAEPTELLKQPKADADFIADVGPFESIQSVDKLGDSDDKLWCEVDVKFEGGKRGGWVRAECTKLADPKDIPQVRPWTFLKNCTIATRLINAIHGKQPDANPAYGVNRDYLLAWAWLATKHPDAASDELQWTFHLRKDEWQRFVDDPQFNDSGYAADDYAEDPTVDPGFQVAQCYGAAYVAYRDHMAISKEVSPKLATDKANNIYVPNSIELLLAHVAGVKVAAALAGADRSAKVADALKGLGVAEDTIKKIGDFLGVSAGTSIDIAAAIQTMDAKLDDAYQKTRLLLLKYTPEDVATIPAASGNPPWMVKAREEEAKHVAETADGKNPEILKYFKATGIDTDRVLDWCGAFVAWCLANSGNAEIAKSVDKANAARAASWARWGTIDLLHRADDIPVGAVVTLSPVDPKRNSGHVGFFVRREAGTITLLGGNQTNKVCEAPRADSRIVAIRWINWDGQKDVVEDKVDAGTISPPDPPQPSGKIFGPFDDADWQRYVTRLGKRESGNNYASVNQFGYCGRWQMGSGALQDLGFVRRGTSQSKKSMSQDRAWLGKNGVASQAAFLAAHAVQDAAILAYTAAHYKQLLRLGGLTQNDKKPRVAGVLAAAHLVGVGGAVRMVKRTANARDGNGVSASQYFAMLSEEFGGPRAV